MVSPLDAKAKEVVDALRAACVGHPAAKIPWPHRLLHDSADLITAQAERIAELKEISGTTTDMLDYIFALKDRAEAAEAEVRTLREALIKTGRNLGAGLADNVSNEFLTLIPEEAALVRAAALRAKEP